MYIYSTASNDMRFHLFKDREKGKVARVKHSILVMGKANITTKALHTPKGIVTSVNDADYKLLENNKLFKKCVKDGFLTVDTKKLDAENVAIDMEPKDGSAPLEANDLSKKHDEAGLHGEKDEPKE